MSARTPGPWVRQGYGTVAHPVTRQPIICDRIETGTGSLIDLVDETNEPEENAAFIVEACNAYESLRADNARLREALEECTLAISSRENTMGDPCSLIEAKARLADAATKARAALAKGGE